MIAVYGSVRDDDSFFWIKIYEEMAEHIALVRQKKCVLI